jgi:hypothetical protein
MKQRTFLQRCFYATRQPSFRRKNYVRTFYTTYPWFFACINIYVISQIHQQDMDTPTKPLFFTHQTSLASLIFVAEPQTETQGVTPNRWQQRIV